MLKDLRNDSSDRLVGDIVDDLDKIERGGDAASWAKAERYVTGYDELAKEDPYKKLSGQKLTRQINNDLRAKAAERDKVIPRPSFLSNARKLADTWPEIFTFGSKDLPYQHYSQVAVSSLPREQKDELREWMETEQPTREVLRRKIRDEVDARNAVYREDFELKVSNFWRFNEHWPNDSYGGIHPGIVANLLYWFTEPGDTVLDPMAGTGLLADTVERHKFYQQEYEAEGSGRRNILMSDLAPTREDIAQADARISLPFDDGSVDLAIIDPPYLVIADGKYENLGNDVDEWLDGLCSAVLNVKRCLKPGGRIAVITDDVLRKGNHVPIAYLITGMLAEIGINPIATIYNQNPNYIYTMGPAQMKAARMAKMQLNGCKIIQVGGSNAHA